MPSVISEPVRAGEFLVSEANGYRSRETIVLTNLGGAEVSLSAGLVLAQRTVGAASTAAKSGGNTGTGTITMDPTTPILARAKAGVYTVRCIATATNGGTFRLEDPDGDVIADAAISGGAGGTAAFAEQIKFVITDAGTDFSLGDGFDVTVAAGDGRYVPFTNAANLPAAAILYGPVTVAAESAASGAGVVRDAEVNGHVLQYVASLSGGGLTAAKAAAAVSLKAAGIIIRS